MPKNNKKKSCRDSTGVTAAEMGSMRCRTRYSRMDYKRNGDMLKETAGIKKQMTSFEKASERLRPGRVNSKVTP
jgi:hypothetical protein